MGCEEEVGGSVARPGSASVIRHRQRRARCAATVREIRGTQCGRSLRELKIQPSASRLDTQAHRWLQSHQLGADVRERAAKSETELHENDLEFSYYENDELDTDQLIREQLELALPARVLCREDCRGLCAQCGTNLNLETCQCTAPVDPRWQALAELKDKLEQND